MLSSSRRSGPPPSGRTNVARLELPTRTESSVQTRSPAASVTQSAVALRRISTRPSTELTSADHSSQLRAAWALDRGQRPTSPTIAARGRRRWTGPFGVAASSSAAFAVAYEPSTTLLFARARRDDPQETAAGSWAGSSYAELTIKLLSRCVKRATKSILETVDSCRGCTAASARARRRSRCRGLARELAARHLEARGESRSQAAVHRARAVASVDASRRRRRFARRGARRRPNDGARHLAARSARAVARPAQRGWSERGRVRPDVSRAAPRRRRRAARRFDRAGRQRRAARVDRERRGAARRPGGGVGREAQAASAGAEGGSARLGAVRLADGAGQRRTVLDLRQSQRRHAVATRRGAASAPAAVLRGVSPASRARAAGCNGTVAANARCRAGAAQPRKHDDDDPPRISSATPASALRRVASSSEEITPRQPLRRWRCCSICMPARTAAS